MKVTLQRGGEKKTGFIKVRMVQNGGGELCGPRIAL